MYQERSEAIEGLLDGFADRLRCERCYLNLVTGDEFIGWVSVMSVTALSKGINKNLMFAGIFPLLRSEVLIFFQAWPQY